VTAEDDADWRPTAPLHNLRRRAELVARVRGFFAARGVLEVETPLLAAAAVTDVHLASLATRLHAGAVRAMWLQTSPELHMKRLLAAGSGPIWQLGKAFRDGEAGRRHNPEFTILEWYRPGWDHHRLMDEVEALLGDLLGSGPAERLTYREALRRHAGVDPFTASASELATAAAALGVAVAGPAPDRDTWLQLLLTVAVEPRLGRERPSFLHDFPAAQAALARVRPGEPPVAERFEAFVAGVELANGYHELTDPVEQERRFHADLAERRRRGLPEPPYDGRLLAALAHGLPASAGVALGFDRLVMLAVGATSLGEVIAFPVDRA
jgi:elongation factor P--(R)-beta-lysine ligase